MTIIFAETIPTPNTSRQTSIPALIPDHYIYDKIYTIFTWNAQILLQEALSTPQVVLLPDIMDEHDHGGVGHDHGFECGGGNEYDGRLGLRISAIFVIGFGSMLGALLPLFMARKRSIKGFDRIFFACKYFGSGVIIATAFIHLLPPAQDYLGSDCLTGPITEYPWVEGIAMMAIFAMFFSELMATRFKFEETLSHDADSHVESATAGYNGTTVRQRTSIPKSGAAVNGGHGHHHGSPSSSATTVTDQEASPSRTISNIANVHYPPGPANHLSHQLSHSENDNLAAQLTSIFILEFGILFHSFFIGLTLAVSAAKEFVILYIVLVFHQTFEGLGLGSRLASIKWAADRRWLPWVLGLAYGFTTPVAIAIGLGIRETFKPGSRVYLLVNGIFDSISAGILIYTGLVELMAHEFLFDHDMTQAPISKTLAAFGFMCLGAGLMALLGKWA